LELSSDWAYKIKHNYIGTEHLLLGLIHENEGVAAQVLMNLGLSLEKVRTETLELLGATMSDEDDAPPSDPLKDLANLASHGQYHLFDAYQSFTASTAIYPGAGSGDYEAMTYVALKGSGECGEFNEKLGKWMRTKGSIRAMSRRNMTEEFRLELAKELGDVVWYMARAADELGYKFSEIIKLNVDKLSSRKNRGVLDGSGDNR
jgi:NTP pyrophosphatase (non-canonical NTP hydrolase)